ncbi:MAG TPA: hypothetical protein VK803_12200 [Steroidobacteraceae bacterium]|nr:hypothetical protein [Steroidobacteraceae bacterium]
MSLPRAAALGTLLGGALLIGVPAPAAAPHGCAVHTGALPAVTRLRAAWLSGRFVAYQPTSLQVTDGHITPATEASIRADLTVLRRRFDALITYDAVHGAQAIPAIAAELKFHALIIGVWNPADASERAAALAAARRFPQLVEGLSLGNELLFAHRSDPQQLAALLAVVRTQFPGVALTVSEPFHIYYEPTTAALLRQLDFLLVNVHPVFQPWFRDAPDGAAAQFVVNVLAQLAPLACGPILVKETGVPSAPASAGFSEARQAGFYRELARQLPPGPARAFAWFAAFDAPWRAYDATGVPGAAPAVHAEEAHWGLYDAQRRPKLAARELAQLPGEQ